LIGFFEAVFWLKLSLLVEVFLNFQLFQLSFHVVLLFSSDVVEFGFLEMNANHINIYYMVQIYLKNQSSVGISCFYFSLLKLIEITWEELILLILYQFFLIHFLGIFFIIIIIIVLFEFKYFFIINNKKQQQGFSFNISFFFKNKNSKTQFHFRIISAHLSSIIFKTQLSIFWHYHLSLFILIFNKTHKNYLT